MRVVVVGIGSLPLLGLQERERSHTLQHLHGGSASAVGEGRFTVLCCGICSHHAGILSATEDVVWVDELAVSIEGRFAVVPCLEIAAIPHLVPDDVDGEVVLQLAVLAFLLTTLILGERYEGVAGDVGRVLDGAV